MGHIECRYCHRYCISGDPEDNKHNRTIWETCDNCLEDMSEINIPMDYERL